MKRFNLQGSGRVKPEVRYSGALVRNRHEDVDGQESIFFLSSVSHFVQANVLPDGILGLGVTKE